MIASAWFEIGEREFEVSAEVSFGRRSRGWEPDEGMEVELQPFVQTSTSPEISDVVTLDTFLIEYAIETGQTLRKAEEQIEDRLLCEAIEDRDDQDRRYE